MTSKPILKAFFCLLCGLGLPLALFLSLARPVYAATLTVDTTADDAVANGNCTLREAIQAANTNTTVDGCLDPGDAGQDTIIFSPAVSGTISLGSALPLISEPLLIDGAGQNITVSGNNTVRVFDASAPLSLQGIIVTQGYAGEGGGIRATAALTLINVQVISNTTVTLDGGGVMAYATLTLTNTDFINNIARDNGGGIRATGPTIISGGSFQNNRAIFGNGGGLSSFGNSAVMIDNSIFISNRVDMSDGGGMSVDGGNLTLTNTDFIDNIASSDGGAIVIYTTGCSLAINGGLFDRNRVLLANHFGGGAILSFCPTTISSAIFQNNNVIGSGPPSRGGAVRLIGAPAAIDNSAFSHNRASQGGGIDSDNILHLARSSVLSNSAVANGGGIYLPPGAATAIENTTLAYNQVFNGYGGGIDTFGNLSMTNTTIYSNSASKDSGGIGIGNGTARLVNVTIANNTAGTGQAALFNSANLDLINSLVANNSPADCHNNGVIGANTNNLIEDGSCNPALTGDPLLEPLQNNGGATLTAALLPGSPAIDAGTNTGCPVSDQRDVVRPLDGDGNALAVCDIGAFEGPSMPDIEVWGSGQRIAAGDTTPTSSDGTDFGAVVGSRVITRTFVISNNGGGDLLLTGSPAVTLSRAAAFSLVVTPVTPIGAGSNVPFQVKFDPPATGLFTATLTIASNDPDENPYRFTVQGLRDTPSTTYLPLIIRQPN